MSLFGNPPASGSSLFGNSTTSQPQQTGGSLFGNTPAAQNKPTLNLFGSSTSTSQPQQSSGLFGGSSNTSQPQQTSSLFGNAAGGGGTGGGLFANNTSNKPGTSSIFGGGAVTQQTSQAPATSGLFGGTNTQNSQPPATSSLFGSTQQNAVSQPAAGNSLFGNRGPGLSTQQSISGTAPSMPPPPEDFRDSMIDSRRLWNEEDGAPRSRTVLEQLQIVARKWDPASTQHAFQAYLYNQVDPSAAPFYRPGPTESEEAWEEALRKAPTPGSIPFRVRGFYELGLRIVSQRQHLDVLSGRLHEINNGLTTLLQKHEVDIASRTAAARRRHAALSQRVLTLATKAMIARNRGYALDAAEEGLRRKLVGLERTVMDPALNGREEEIWARMVSLREKGRMLEAEMARIGGQQDEEGRTQEISEEVMKQAKKILDDYDSQLSHLTKELEKIKEDWTAWEDSKTTTNGVGRR